MTIVRASTRSNSSPFHVRTRLSSLVSADPNIYLDTEPFDKLTPNQLVTLILDIDMTAGSSVPIDLHAAKMFQRMQCETIVLDGGDPERFLLLFELVSSRGRDHPGSEKQFPHRET